MVEKERVEISFSEKTLDFNPFRQPVLWIKITMIVMYFLFIVLGIFLIGLLIRYESTLRYWVFLIFILMLFVGTISVNYMFSKGVEARTDKGWFDAWSFAHFFRDVFLVIFPYYFGVPLWGSILIALGGATFYEIFEYKIVEKYWYNFGAEDSINHFSDLIIAGIGCIFAINLITLL